MTVLQTVLDLLDHELELNGRAQHFTAATRLIGDLPEFDSMAVAYVVAAMEERFEVRIDDEEVTAALFATVGSMAAFIESKQAEQHTPHLH